MVHAAKNLNGVCWYGCGLSRVRRALGAQTWLPLLSMAVKEKSSSVENTMSLADFKFSNRRKTHNSQVCLKNGWIELKAHQKHESDPEK